jgi:hypothetical protein
MRRFFCPESAAGGERYKIVRGARRLDSEVKTLSVSLRATSGVTDLSFITRLRVTMAPDGVLPEHDWTGDVTAHFSGTIKYKS